MGQAGPDNKRRKFLTFSLQNEKELTPFSWGC
uniref:Uncharacterized protein n=1 Tax=Rhizophora mucronata TaxID=61149 RepID=A0A2P2NNC4_RHIMU